MTAKKTETPEMPPEIMENLEGMIRVATDEDYAAMLVLIRAKHSIGDHADPELVQTFHEEGNAIAREIWTTHFNGKTVGTRLAVILALVANMARVIHSASRGPCNEPECPSCSGEQDQSLASLPDSAFKR